eukprot:c28465_g1_i1 orf=56-208(+)
MSFSHSTHSSYCIISMVKFSLYHALKSMWLRHSNKHAVLKWGQLVHVEYL